MFPKFCDSRKRVVTFYKYVMRLTVIKSSVKNQPLLEMWAIKVSVIRCLWVKFSIAFLKENWNLGLPEPGGWGRSPSPPVLI